VNEFGNVGGLGAREPIIVAPPVVMSVLLVRGANMKSWELNVVEVRTDWFFRWVTFRTVTSGVLNLLPGAKSLARLGHCHLTARITMMMTLATPLCRGI
jgi:hypothetical protein